MAVETIFRLAKCKDKLHRDMRYSTEWLFEVLLLRIKSPSVYDHIRRQNLMPLPSRGTLRRLINSLVADFGFQHYALESIERERPCFIFYHLL